MSKDHRLLVRFDDRQWQRLDTLARLTGKAKAEVLRYLVDTARLRAFPDGWQPPNDEEGRP